MPVTLKRKKKKEIPFTPPLKESPGLLSLPQTPWGPALDSLQFAGASLVLGGTKLFPVPRCGSPELSRENYAFPRPAACALAGTALQRTDPHHCLWTGSPPPLDQLITPWDTRSSPALLFFHQLPFFSIQYFPYGSHASSLSYEHIPSLPPLLWAMHITTVCLTKWHQLFL